MLHTVQGYMYHSMYTNALTSHFI